MDVNPAGVSSGGAGTASLSVGDKVRAAVVSSDGKGNLLLNIKGFLVKARAEGEAAPGKAVRAEIVKTEPELLVKVLPENASSRQALKAGLSDAARLVQKAAENKAVSGMKSSETSVFKEAAPALAKEAASFNQKEVADILKNLGGARIAAFLPAEIKKAVRNGGNFFENKLLKGISPEKDAKMLAYSSGMDAARGAVTKMQAANILMNADIFTFFEGDEELDFDSGVMRFRKTASGDINLYMKLDFTNLGETVLSFVKSPGGGYYVTVRTEKDISEDLTALEIPGVFPRWYKLGAKDVSFFDIKREDFVLFDNFDIKA